MDRSQSRLYGATPFQRHLSFFDYFQTGLITPKSSLYASLSLGLNFPVSCLYALGLHLTYSNTGLLNLGGIDVRALSPRKERSQLQDVPTGKTRAGTAPQRYDRAGLMSLVRGKGMLDRVHVLGFWAVAADPEGFVAADDVQRFQRGEVLGEVSRRRAASREDVVPFLRGGPGSVSGHSWVVYKLFGVQIYQDKTKTRTRS